MDTFWCYYTWMLRDTGTLRYAYNKYSALPQLLVAAQQLPLKAARAIVLSDPDGTLRS
jgi:hypothetical protein